MAFDAFRPRSLEGKTAFVTGGGSGINLRIAEAMAEHGARIALLGRTPEKLETAAQGIRNMGREAHGFPADVRDYAAVDLALEAAAAQLGPIDLLICGAAGNFPAPALGMSANGFKAVVDIDLLGTFNTCRAAYSRLRVPGASVINISAPQATLPMAFQSHVCAAKAGVEMLSKVLAAEWGPAGVRVNVVVPGAVDGTEGMRRLAPTEEVRSAMMDRIPLRRFASMDDIANTVLFLASDAARYVTGAVFTCDGGLSLRASAGFA
jgi:NAD(P)-dependent dehydrogenase (short-subunit alcohol dehydrogenase family)